MIEETRSGILVVDDDEEFLSYVRAALEDEGYRAVCAASADEARRLLKERRFALVLADLRLPGASGLDVLREAREADPLAVGVVVTAHSSMESAMEAMREGAYDYLVKPCAPEALVAAVRRAIEHYGLKLALLEKTAQLEELKLKLHDKSRMIQNVSHELKNPLSVVYGYSAYLLKQPGSHKPEDLRRSLQSIHSNAQRLGHLLEEMLESARIASHKVELAREAVAARDLLSEAADNARFEADQRGIDLRVEAPAREWLVNADTRRVQQVLGNLVSNALKFTPRGGTVTLFADEDEGFVRFGVSDTGVGISPEDMPHLFERFFQAESTRKEHKGLGLGLEICRGLVELHGGRVWAESEPGKGSSFYFTLPLCVPRRGRLGARRAA